jgi:hypothetical protein
MSRKWYISSFSTETEVIETVFKATWMAMYHEVKEKFRYKGALVYSPHFDINARVAAASGAKFDKRADP